MTMKIRNGSSAQPFPLRFSSLFIINPLSFRTVRLNLIIPAICGTDNCFLIFQGIKRQGKTVKRWIFHEECPPRMGDAESVTACKEDLWKTRGSNSLPASRELPFMGCPTENQRSVFGGERTNSGMNKALPFRQCRGIWNL